MMDLVTAAKCGLIDNMFLATTGLPMLPTVVAVSAFVIAQAAGRTMAHFLALRPIRRRDVLVAVRTLSIVVAVLLIAGVTLRGFVFPTFLARVAKDAYYCSYFEAGRDLALAHLIVFVMMFLSQMFSVAFFDDRRLRGLEPRWLRSAVIAGYALLGMTGYVLAIALDATLVPLTILFILPFAFCGIGILARQR